MLPPRLSPAEAPITGRWRAFERGHRAMRASVFLQRFSLLTRALLVLGFIAPGCTKLLGRDFAPGIDPLTAMGAFFVAFHGAGSYYPFVGFVQVTASLLLMSRRTALLGACVYLAVIGNIFVLVTATHFSTGTGIMTGLMTLACVWLLVWDAHRLAPLLGDRAPLRARAPEPALWDLFMPLHAQPGAQRVIRAGYVLGLGAGIGLTLFARGLYLAGGAQALAVMALVGGLFTVWGWVLHRWRPGEPPVPSE